MQKSWLSLERLTIVGQFVVIIVLGYWILQEYSHNVYLREYEASFWAANWWLAPAVVVGLIVFGGLAYYNRGSLMVDEGEMEKVEEKAQGPAKVGVVQKELVTSSGVVVLDVCPYCNIPLRIVGDDRYHCRKCRRYFKK